MNELSVENITKTFKISEKQRKALGTNEKTKTAIRGLTFTASKGEIFGLLGPNGAGKTTAMRVISTLIKPDSGDVKLDGVSVAKEPEKVRADLAFLTMDLKLDEKSTANEMFDFFGSLHHIAPDKLEKRKTELFSHFGVDSFADTPIRKLSQGMKQKVSLAVSVVHDPQFVIFDEPTNGLDVLAVRDVREFIMKMKDEGKCVIISTHIFDLVEKLCDRVGMIIDGKIAVCGELNEIMNGRPLEDVFYDIYSELHKEEVKA